MKFVRSCFNGAHFEVNSIAFIFLHDPKFLEGFNCTEAILDRSFY